MFATMHVQTMSRSTYLLPVLTRTPLQVQKPPVTPQPMDHDSAQQLNYEDSRTDVCHAAQLLDLPDSLLQQHLLPLLGGDDKKMLR